MFCSVLNAALRYRAIQGVERVNRGVKRHRGISLCSLTRVFDTTDSAFSITLIESRLERFGRPRGKLSSARPTDIGKTR